MHGLMREGRREPVLYSTNTVRLGRFLNHSWERYRDADDGEKRVNLARLRPDPMLFNAVRLSLFALSLSKGEWALIVRQAHDAARTANRTVLRSDPILFVRSRESMRRTLERRPRNSQVDMRHLRIMAFVDSVRTPGEI